MAKTSEMTQTMRIPRTSLEPDTEATTSEWGCPAAPSRIDREVLGLSLPSRWQPRIFLLVALALVVPHHQFFLPKSLAADDPILTNEHTSLTPQAAESLSARNRSLHLNGLSTLPAPVARVLASHTGFLYLNGLTGLDSDTADILAGHTGPLRLNAVTTIDAPTAAALARHTGDLELLGLRSLSDEAALRIAKYNGVLRLNPAVACSTNAKDYMSQQKILSDAASKRNRQRWLDTMARLEVARVERQRASAANIAITPSSGTAGRSPQNTSESTPSSQPDFRGFSWDMAIADVMAAQSEATTEKRPADRLTTIEGRTAVQDNPYSIIYTFFDGRLVEVLVLAIYLSENPEMSTREQAWNPFNEGEKVRKTMVEKYGSPSERDSGGETDTLNWHKEGSCFLTYRWNTPRSFIVYHASHLNTDSKVYRNVSVTYLSRTEHGRQYTKYQSGLKEQQGRAMKDSIQQERRKNASEL
jgi:hypothetical protein